MSGIQSLFGIRLPIVQGGMVWVSGGKLAGHVSKAGGLGLVGAGSMQPDLLRQHILNAKALTSNPIGINIPLLYSKVQEQIDIALNLGIKIFFTSAGSPKTWTPYLKSKGAIVVHVTSSPLLAKKCEDSGVDAVVAEGFEAGGHNGRDEITTLVLIREVVETVKIPVIAAGGIADGRGIAAMFALGAQGVQIGSRFAATQESSAHPNFKKAIIEAGSDATMLSMKKLVPVRLLKNKFYQTITELEEKGASLDELKACLGKGRAKLGMLDGDLDEGELEIGQASGLISDIPTVQELMTRFEQDYKEAVASLPKCL